MWVLTRGPLAGRLGTMDAEWLATLSSKIPVSLDWRWSVWLINLLSPALIVAFYLRRRAEAARARETAWAGSLALLVVFLRPLPFNAAHVQLAIQLQPRGCSG